VVGVVAADQARGRVAGKPDPARVVSADEAAHASAAGVQRSRDGPARPTSMSVDRGAEQEEHVTAQLVAVLDAHPLGAVAPYVREAPAQRPFAIAFTAGEAPLLAEE